MTTDRKWGEFYRDSSGNLVKDFPIHPGQEAILKSTARITAAIAGTGGGKTSVIPLWLMKQIEKNPQGRFIIVSYNFKMLRRSVLKEIEETFSGLSDLEGTFNENKWEYLCPCGAKLYLYSADDPKSIQAVHADGAVIDECGLVKSDVFTTVRQRTNSKKAPLLLTSTPYGFNWLYYDVYLKFKEGNPDYKVVSFKSTDNPTYSKDEFEAEKLRLPEWRFRQLYLGEFTRPDGLVYPEIESCVITQDKLPPVNGRGLDFIGGLDFGFNDPMCALAGFIHEGVLYVFYEKYKRGHTIDDFAKNCDANGCGCKPIPQSVYWSCDSSRPDSIKDLRRLGFHAKKCKKYSGSVADNIDYINGLMRTGKLKIVKGPVTALLEEANLYCYSSAEREGEYTDKPTDQNNHACDALAYLCQEVKRRRLL